MQHPDVCIAGAGIIGLSLALELRRRNIRVTVLEQATPLAEASTAAAGMLAATDHDNPPQLGPLADLSLSLYPAFLDRLYNFSGISVPFHTSATLQAFPPHSNPLDALAPDQLHHLLPQLTPSGRRFHLLSEHSLDPRELATSLLAASRSANIDLRAHTRVLSVRSTPGSIAVDTTAGTLDAAYFVDCTGAWASATSPLPHLRVTPRKGQMLVVSLPPTLPLHLVVRTPEIYIVPRINTSRAIIGATIEDVGFDKIVHPADIARLQSLAAALLPPLASAPILETWAGLRPSTLDGLPLLGPMPGQHNRFLATGHYRNGILLAPATAHLMAQLLAGEAPTIDLAPFAPSRSLAPT